jgi:hypothetical protein
MHKLSTINKSEQHKLIQCTFLLDFGVSWQVQACTNSNTIDEISLISANQLFGEFNNSPCFHSN